MKKKKRKREKEPANINIKGYSHFCGIQIFSRARLRGQKRWLGVAGELFSVSSGRQWAKPARQCYSASRWRITRQQRFSQWNWMFPWLGQDRPKLLLNSGGWKMSARPSLKGDWLQTSSTGPRTKALKWEDSMRWRREATSETWNQHNVFISWT